MKMFSILFVVGAISLVVTVRSVSSSFEEADQSRTDLDLISLPNTVFALEKINGRLPTNEEMRVHLSTSGKDIYGNPYIVEIHSAPNLVVIVATATGEDGKVGGYGDDSDRTKVFSRP